MNEHTHDGARDDVFETLRAELARVEVSPDFADRVRRTIDQDVIASIGEELSELSVSPEFAVRVRQQIEETPARSRWFSFFDWRWAVPVAAAAVIAAVALTRGGAPDTPGVNPSGVQARVPEPPVSQAPQAPSIAPGSQPPQIAAARATERTATSAAASGQQAEDKLEVITNQPAVLRRLWARAGPHAELVGGVEGVAVTSGEIVFPPIEVSPIVVKSLIDPEATVLGSTPIIRRVTADQAERSPR